MLSEINQGKTNAVWPHLYVESKKNSINRYRKQIGGLVVARGGQRVGGGQMGEGSKVYKLPVIK